MSKKFLLDLPNTEHQALKVAAAQANRSMHQFVRDAITEKIRREHASASLHAPTIDANETDVPDKAEDKSA